jgi:hypothetical protein
MAVSDARDDWPALEIDHARGGADVCSHGFVRPDCPNTVAGNRDRLRDCQSGINRDDLAIAQHQVGGGCAWRCR